MTTHEEVESFAGEASHLLWTLDDLRAGTNDFVAIELAADPDRFVQVSRQEDGTYVLEVRDGPASPLRGTRAADILDVHQAILAWTRGDARWMSAFTWRELNDDNGYSVGDAAVRPIAEEPVDYATTGLSIQEAMLHHGDVNRQLGRSEVAPPIITWGSFLVRTGDIITGIPVRGVVTVSLVYAALDYRQGVQLVAPDGTLDGSEGGFILWNDDRVQSATLHYESPSGRLLVTNVYEMPGLDSVKKWDDNAGMWVEQNSLVERTYHCSYYDTTPPTFEDLVFRLALA